eukprot:jgi/Mesvir1/2556/Mv09613-RA.1
MQAPGSSADVEVTWEDQQSINQFGRLNTRLHEVKALAKAKKEEAELLEDAENEIMLMDGDSAHVRVAEVFIETSREDLEKLLEDHKALVAAESAALEGELASILNKMAGLKKVLYGKFKDSINLEDDK